MKEKVILAYSTGKDSNYALWQLLQQSKLDLVGLFTTVSEEYNRVNMHGVDISFLQEQALSLKLPLDIFYITKSQTHEEYGQKMQSKMLKYRQKNIKNVAFGDIFLENLKMFRINNLKLLDMHAIFPLWKMNTLNLIEDFIFQGFQSIITCVDTNFLDISFLGQKLDWDLIKKLPKNIDFCGENGEYHSFVFDGPTFSYPISFKKGKILQVDNYAYLEIL